MKAFKRKIKSGNKRRKGGKGGRRNPERVQKKRNGVVAHLPKAVRDVINRMIEEGKEYQEIEAKVREEGHEVSMGHLISWRQGGYQDWLWERERLIHMRLIREFAQEVVRENQGKEVQEAAIEIATSQIYEMLTEFDPKTLRERLKRGNPVDYTRMLTALARMSDGGLKYERYRAEVEEKKRKMRQLLNESKGEGLTEETIAQIEETLRLM